MNGVAAVYYGSSPAGLKDGIEPLEFSTKPAWFSQSSQGGFTDFGRSVSSAGDVNGDGFVDVIVGAPKNKVGGIEKGEAVVYYGGPTGLGSIYPPTTLNNPAAGFGAQFGHTVAGGGPPGAAADSDPPSNVGNVSPLNGATGVFLTPTLVAQTASDATLPISYYFELYSGPGCVGPPLETRAYGVETAWDPAPLSPGTTYRWRNRARDAVAPTPNVSAFGPCWSFTTAAADSPPTVSITSPTGGATVSGIRTITATAADDLGVTGVQFQLDGANLGGLDATPPYSRSWNTAGVPNGPHELRAIAFDTGGQSTISSPITVTVSNVAIPAPCAVGELCGWAWAENIGWIHFSNGRPDCVNPGTLPYGVCFDEATGALSGYAWSEHLGWLSFERSTAGNPPADDIGGGSGPIAKIDLATGELAGWARFLSNGGGWDGWVKLAKGPSDSGAPYAATKVGQDLQEFAWGGDLVGWISFNSLNCDQPIPRLGCPPVGTPIATYKVTLAGGGGGSISVRLAPLPATGQEPLIDVDLKAVVSFAVGDITYEFDCDVNDGNPAEPPLVVPQPPAEYTEVDLCDYPVSGRYVPLVTVTDANGNSDTDTAGVVVTRGKLIEIPP